jgi:Na+/melibiose symporter-like transporter
VLCSGDMAVLRSLIIVAVAVVAFWFVAGMLGLNVSLFWTLILSVLLTLALSLVSRPRVSRRWD